jgi:hypothetical protein
MDDKHTDVNLPPLGLTGRLLFGGPGCAAGVGMCALEQLSRNIE